MTKPENPPITREIQLAAAIDELTELVALFDENDRIVLANKAWRELNRDIIEFTEPGVKFEDHLRAAIKKGLIPEAVGREEEWLRERMERHLNPRGPFEVARQGGRWLLIHEQRLPNNAIILIDMDITEQKNVAEELRQSEERFKAFITHLPAKMHIKDAQGRYLLINPMSERLFGISNEDAIGKTAANIFPQHMGEVFGAHDREVLRTDSAITTEEEFPSTEGPRIFLTVKFPIHDADGNVIAVGASGIDITERKRAEQALKDAHKELEQRVEERTRQLEQEVELRKQIAADLKISEERFRDIAASSSDWFWEMGPDLRFTYIDESFREITGVDPKVYLGKTRRDFAEGHVDSEALRKHLDDMDHHRPFRNFQYEVTQSDGSSQYISISGTPVFDANGEFMGYRGAGSNVTAQVVSEQRARQAQEEMRLAKEEAEKASQAKTNFLSSMSHELRTPMNAILGFAQLLEYDSNTPLTDIQQENVHYIIDAGQHLLHLIADVLELNKIEAGKLSLDIDDVSAKHVINDCMRQVQLKAGENNIRIIDRCSQKKIPWIKTDAIRLKQVILNILVNAIKYNRKQGTVTVACEVLVDAMLRISITDEGEGIPPDRQADLFVPFERLGRESGHIEGTGIGLTIAKRIIDMLQGRIGFKSEQGHGSTFWIDVPISDNQLVDLAGPEADTTADRRKDFENNIGAAHTILYIEDNPANMKLMQMTIAQLSNMQMLAAYTAEQGIELARQHLPDLILMDINLPGVNGIEALRRLQQIKETANIPVIAISADAMPRDIQKALAAGFKDYITKPIDIVETHRVINTILGH